MWFWFMASKILSTSENIAYILRKCQTRKTNMSAFNFALNWGKKKLQNHCKCSEYLLATDNRKNINFWVALWLLLKTPKASNVHWQARHMKMYTEWWTLSLKTEESPFYGLPTEVLFCIMPYQTPIPWILSKTWNASSLLVACPAEVSKL